LASPNDEGDLSDQTDGNDRDQGDGNGEGNHALGERKLILLHVLVAGVFMLVCLEDRVVDTLMRANLEADIDRIGDQEQDGCDAGYVEDIIGDFFCWGATFGVYCGVEYSRDDEAKTTISCQPEVIVSN